MRCSGCGEESFGPMMPSSRVTGCMGVEIMGIEIRLLDDHSSRQNDYAPPKQSPPPPPHGPLEDFPYMNNTLHPHTLASTHDFVQITNAQDTHRRGRWQYLSKTTFSRDLFFFFTAPPSPSHPTYRKCPLRPPVLFIKVSPQPPSSPGLVLVSVEMMVDLTILEEKIYRKAKKMRKNRGTKFLELPGKWGAIMPIQCSWLLYHNSPTAACRVNTAW
jgi:hypothetical protein